MNHLAHVFLAETNPESRLGNILADYVKPPVAKTLSVGVQKGIRQHYCVDSYTDSHPLVQQCIRCISAKWGWFSGIIIDVFFDYLLIQNWNQYSEVLLLEYVHLIERDLSFSLRAIPPITAQPILKIIQQGRLASLQHWNGVEAALVRLTKVLEHRIPQRARNLALALSDLQDHHDVMNQHFVEFFPQLQQHCQGWLAGQNGK